MSSTPALPPPDDWSPCEGAHLTPIAHCPLPHHILSVRLPLALAQGSSHAWIGTCAVSDCDSPCCCLCPIGPSSAQVRSLCDSPRDSRTVFARSCLPIGVESSAQARSLDLSDVRTEVHKTHALRFAESRARQGQTHGVDTTEGHPDTSTFATSRARHRVTDALRTLASLNLGLPAT
jgi:hypothetical protein